MFTSLISWVKGLSVVGKVMTGLVSLGAVSVLAAPLAPTNSVTTPSSAEVKAADSVKEPVITTEIVTETEPIAFVPTNVETSSLNKGVTQITTAGKNGEKTLTYTITKSDGIQINKTLDKEEVTTPPVNQVTSVGTYVPPAPRPTNCDPNYTPCVPNVSYDLDCADIGFSVRVIGSDPNRFDRDGDGYGCESY